jgi:type IV pilus assembly protein PilW
MGHAHGIVKRRRRELGLSLVELMVSMVMGVFLLAGVVSIFIANRQSYRTADALGRVQESLRMTAEYLGRDLRGTGAFGCVAANLESTSAHDCALMHQKRGLKNLVNGGAGSHEHGFERPIVGMNADDSEDGWTPALDASVSSLLPAPASGSDVLVVRVPTGPALTVLGHGTNPEGEDDLTVRSVDELATGDIVMVTDCESAAVFQISALTPAPDGSSAERSVAHAVGGMPGNQCLALGKHYVNGQLMRVATRVYFVAPGASGQASLFRQERDGDPVELVEGVENLQITYGVDPDGDGRLDEYREADAIAGGWDQVVSVRIDYVVASPGDNITTEPQTYALAGETFTAPDRRLRQVSSFTVAVRNRLQ